MTLEEMLAAHLLQAAHRHSEALRPPRWRFKRYREWKRHDQPGDILASYRLALIGSRKPAGRVGVQLRRYDHDNDNK